MYNISSILTIDYVIYRGCSGGYGWVTVFKFVAKNGRIDYVTTNRENWMREHVERVIKARWSVEVYHRELKKPVVLNAARPAPLLLD